MNLAAKSWLAPAILGFFLMFSGCSSSKTSDKAAPPPPGAAAGTGTVTGTSSADVTSNGPGLYLGFDGSNVYSILQSGGRTWTIADPSIATVKKETITLSTDTIDSLITDLKKTVAIDATGESFIRQMLGCEQSALRFVPLKPGKTTMSGTRNGGNGGDRWGTSNTTTAINVIQYTPAQYNAGKVRYTTDGSGNLKACRSCHETGDEGAPPHELGHIDAISDAQAVEWITTGKTGTRVARIQHTWEFSSDDQKFGTVAYLRAKASKDIEAFTKLVFQERYNDIKDRLPKGGTGTGTAAGTPPGGGFRCRPNRGGPGGGFGG